MAVTTLWGGEACSLMAIRLQSAHEPDALFCVCDASMTCVTQSIQRVRPRHRLVSVIMCRMGGAAWI